MIYLEFAIGAQTYGLAGEQIVELVPRVGLTEIIGAPPYVPGFFNYRGKIVPVIDLALLATGTAATACIGTRIAVVQYDSTHLLGLMLENATEIIYPEASAIEWQDHGIKTECQYIGRIMLTNGKTIQLVKVENILSEEAKAIIFKD